MKFKLPSLKKKAKSTVEKSSRVHNGARIESLAKFDGTFIGGISGLLIFGAIAITFAAVTGGALPVGLGLVIGITAVAVSCFSGFNIGAKLGRKHDRQEAIKAREERPQNYHQRATRVKKENHINKDPELFRAYRIRKAASVEDQDKVVLGSVVECKR